MRGTLARQRRRYTAAAVDDRSWLPSAAEVAEVPPVVVTVTFTGPAEPGGEVATIWPAVSLVMVAGVVPK